jgi:iron complex outermembrane receptor protein
MKAEFPNMFTTVAGIPGDAQAVYSQSRYLGITGYEGHGQSGSRDVETLRLGTGLKGSLFDSAIDYDVAVTYSSRQRDLQAKDMYVERMAFALDGLGGDGCTPGGADAATSTPGVGPCEYYNPFSNAIFRSRITGALNPGFDPAVANDPALLAWLWGTQDYKEQSDLLVWDAVLSGETPWTLPGGAIGWAAGVQARNEKYDLSLNSNTNLAKTPCPFRDPYSVTLGNTKTLACTSPTGPFAFLAGAFENNDTRNIYAAFTEFSLPITDKISGQLALRYEDYGTVGSTVDPKLGLRWQATDWLALRASATTTFRGPAQSYLAGQVTSLVFITPTSAFKAVNNIGNPDLQSESATTWSYGFIVNAGGLTATVDYWKYNLKDPFQVEDPNQIVAAYTAQNCYVGAPGAPTANCPALAAHISPLAVPPSQIERIDVHVINGSKIDTSGIDATAQYDFDDVFNGVLSFGVQGTYTIDYNSEDFKDINGVTLAPGGDFAGKMNIGTPFTSLPDLKGNAWAKYVHGPHRLTYMLRYVSDYTDDTALTPSLKDVSSITYQDLYYNVTLFNDSTFLSVGVMNLADKDPPKTSTNLNYDPYTADPFGRMIKVGFTYTLGGK